MGYWILILLAIIFFTFCFLKSKKKQEVSDRDKLAFLKIKSILSDVCVPGVYYRTLDEISRIENLQEGEELVLFREPGNSYDRNAIKVMTKDGYVIGYIPKNLCRLFNEILAEYEYCIFVNRISPGINAPYVYIRAIIKDLE